MTGLQALGGAGSTGIIRVPENSSYHIKKALDLGPAGVSGRQQLKKFLALRLVWKTACLTA